MTLENIHKAERQLDWQADSLSWVWAAAPVNRSVLVNRAISEGGGKLLAKLGVLDAMTPQTAASAITLNFGADKYNRINVNAPPAFNALVNFAVWLKGHGTSMQINNNLACANTHGLILWRSNENRHFNLNHSRSCSCSRRFRYQKFSELSKKFNFNAWLSQSIVGEAG
jgi:hypothetical protein